MSTVLKLGSHGQDVMELQKDLAALAPSLPAEPLSGVQADGIFGPATEAAVKAAQHGLGLLEDGVAGPITLTAINALLGHVPVKPAPTTPDQSPAGEVPRTRAACVKRYGDIANGVWPDENKWMTSVPVPTELQHIWLTDGKSPTLHIGCNKDMASALKQAMQNLIDRGLMHELKSFDGCLNIRNTRGSSSISAHAWGLALDLNCDTNPLGGKSSLSPGFVKCWKDAGFSWGGDFHSRPDPMHMTMTGF